MVALTHFIMRDYIRLEYMYRDSIDKQEKSSYQN